jgi:hypothetical protein
MEEGNIVVFRDDVGNEIKTGLSISNNRYVLISLNDTNNVIYSKDCTMYYVWDFNAKFPETAITSMCEAYNFEFIKIIRNK